MPKGVEHVTLLERVRAKMVAMRSPLMPKGVEHIRCRPVSWP